MTNLTATILIAASLALFFGYVSPTYGRLTGSGELAKKSIKELQKDESEYRDALGKAHDIEKARSGLLDIYNGIPEEDLEKLLKLLPDHIDSVRLIIDINNVAAQYGMTLKNITLASPDASAARSASSAIGPKESRYTGVALKFAVSGSYADFRSFLADIEKSLRLIDIDTLGFTAKGEKDEYDYSVTVSTYRLE